MQCIAIAKTLPMLRISSLVSEIGVGQSSLIAIDQKAGIAVMMKLCRHD